MIVLIPAFEPDERLLALASEIASMGPDIRCVIVNDGSGPTFDAIFDAAAERGAHLVRQEPNRGKGAALKLGFAFVMRRFPGESVVCADCDGQHTSRDIARVMQDLAMHPGSIVLGIRDFKGTVPFRSRFGNTLTSKLFAAATRTDIADTQTGLRGYPASLLPWLCAVPGERFEYELSVLLQATRDNVPVRELGIETIYLERNATSHFRPLQDSVRIYWPLLKFAASSLIAFAVDTVVLMVMHSLTGTVVTSAIVARVVSSTMNFALNRCIVFRDRDAKRLGREARQYWMLVVVLFLVNVTLLKAFVALGLPLLAAKVITEAVLFIGSFSVQRSVVFARTGRRTAAPAASESITVQSR